MTGDEFRIARNDAGITIREAADRIGASTRTIQAWERKGDAPLPPRVAGVFEGEPELDADWANYIVGKIMCNVERDAGALKDDLNTLLTRRPFPDGFAALMQWHFRPGVKHSSVVDERIGELMNLLPGDKPEQARMRAFDASPSLWLGYWHERAELHEIEEEVNP